MCEGSTRRSCAYGQARLLRYHAATVSWFPLLIVSIRSWISHLDVKRWSLPALSALARLVHSCLLRGGAVPRVRHPLLVLFELVGLGDELLGCLEMLSSSRCVEEQTGRSPRVACRRGAL